MRKWYGIVRWATEDVIAAAEANGVTMSEEQAEKWWKENEESFKTIMAEQGSEILFYMDFNVENFRE